MPKRFVFRQQRALSIGFQDHWMMRLWPTFTYKRIDNIPTWTGKLTPTDTGIEYSIEISYRIPKSPRCWILFPDIKDNAPHRYFDKSLCLYYPKDNSWNIALPIALTTVPWASTWIYCYELWLATEGKYGWPGPEAPHNPRRKKHAK